MSAATSEAIENRVTEAMVEIGTDRSMIRPDAKLEDLDIDSLDLVEIAQIMEDEFGVQLKADDVRGLTTVQDAIDLMVSKAT